MAGDEEEVPIDVHALSGAHLGHVSMLPRASLGEAQHHQQSFMFSRGTARDGLLLIGARDIFAAGIERAHLRPHRQVGQVPGACARAPCL